MNLNHSNQSASALIDNAESIQFVSFKLGDETFGIEVSRAREILVYTGATKIPKMPSYMLGVINLREQVVPVIDMRLKLGLETSEQTTDTCVIVVEVNVDGNTLIIGALADAVSEVLDIFTDQIEPPPKLGSRLNTEFICGVGRVEDNFMILLDLDKIFNSDEFSQISESDIEIRQI